MRPPRRLGASAVSSSAARDVRADLEGAPCTHREKKSHPGHASFPGNTLKASAALPDQGGVVLEGFAVSGTYSVMSCRHRGRPAFQQRDPGQGFFLYCWNDGSEGAGWWIGREIGGDEVCATKFPDSRPSLQHSAQRQAPRHGSGGTVLLQQGAGTEMEQKLRSSTRMAARPAGHCASLTPLS